MRKICDRKVPLESMRREKDWMLLLGYPLLCLASLLLSMCFEVAEKQFIAISLISGLRWIFISRETRILIIERS